MKISVSLLLFLALGRAFGQFIPQPMGYNPDENGDAFISVTDLQGMLALYGNAFDNGDSLVISSINFPEDYQPWDGVDPTGYDHRPYFIDEQTDILYVHQVEDQGCRFYLPQGPGYRVVQIFLSCSEFAQWDVRVCGTNEISSLMYGGNIVVGENKPVVLTLVRGHNGIWYQSGPTMW